MNIFIKNCNNINTGEIIIEENKLNIKYAINGTGKSTVAKAIDFKAGANDVGIKSLTPYVSKELADSEYIPEVIGIRENLRVRMFDENYVSQYVFREDELIKDTFEVFINTPDYRQKIEEIKTLLAEVNNSFENDEHIETMIKELEEFMNVFGKSEHGIANNSKLARGFQHGNLIQNIPEELKDYSQFINSESNSKWLRWQAEGKNNYMGLSDNCPFCSNNIQQRRDKVELLSKEYNCKNIEHLSAILDLINRMERYFAVDTVANVKTITCSIEGLSKDQVQYLCEIRAQVGILLDKLVKLKTLSFYKLRDLGKLQAAIAGLRIDKVPLDHLNSEFTVERIDKINNALEVVQVRAASLQKSVSELSSKIKKIIRDNNSEINTFLSNAGYEYTVSLEESEDSSYKLKLKYNLPANIVMTSVVNYVSDAKEHLSYGERNALALVLFMYQAIHDDAELIILDDPISSFDNNKKFAILEMLFLTKNMRANLKGKTVLLLTHDFEPIIDVLRTYSDKFNEISRADFLENNKGVLTERPIVKRDIQSIVSIADENIKNEKINILVRLAYLRRRLEITGENRNAYELISNVFHKRTVPLLRNDDGYEMTEKNIIDATRFIKQSIPEFEYQKVINMLKNTTLMKQYYKEANSNYEKLVLYRALDDSRDGNAVARNFLNKTYHIENDMLFQLNPLKFNTIPNYIIVECDKHIN